MDRFEFRVIEADSGSGDAILLPGAGIKIGSANSSDHAAEIERRIEAAKIERLLAEWRQWRDNRRDDSSLVPLARRLATLLFDQPGEESLSEIYPYRETIITLDPSFAPIPFELLTRLYPGPISECELLRRIRLRGTPPEPRRTIGSEEQSLLAIYLGHQSIELNEEQNQLEELFNSELGQSLDRIYSIYSDESGASNEIEEQLSRCNYLHFAGHANRNSIPLPDGSELKAERLRRLPLRSIRVAFLNGCDSTALAEGAPAFALLEAGVEHLIGFSERIESEIATRAALHFWQHYFTSDCHRALQLSRTELLNEYGRDHPAPYSLTHYGALTSSSNQSQTVRQRTPLSRFALPLAAVIVTTTVALYTLLPLLSTGPTESTVVRRHHEENQRYELHRDACPNRAYTIWTDLYRAAGNRIPYIANSGCRSGREADRYAAALRFHIESRATAERLQSLLMQIDSDQNSLRQTAQASYQTWWHLAAELALLPEVHHDELLLELIEGGWLIRLLQQTEKSPELEKLLLRQQQRIAEKLQRRGIDESRFNTSRQEICQSEHLGYLYPIPAIEPSLAESKRADVAKVIARVEWLRENGAVAQRRRELWQELCRH